MASMSRRPRYSSDRVFSNRVFSFRVRLFQLDTFRPGTFRAPTPLQIFYHDSGSRSDAFAARFHRRSHLSSATPGLAACPL